MGDASEISERTVKVAGLRVFVRERPGEGSPAIFVHGNPNHSGFWAPFLERCEGPVIAFDLPGFGRSTRPGSADFDHTLTAYANVVERLLDELAPRGYRLVVHDWGSVALVAAQREPDRLERLVVINGVPLSGAYRWHWVARIWRRRWLGEAFNALNTKAATRQLLRLARPGRKEMPAEFVDAVWEGWDAGMSHAILGLYRSADPPALAAAGSRLHELRCPALVAWGQDDPYIGAVEGRRYADVLPNSELLELGRAGHWPWIDRPELVGQVVEFLRAS